MRPARVVFERGLRLMKRWLLDWVVSLLVEQHLESTTTTTAAVPSLVEFHEFRVASNWMGEKEREREREDGWSFCWVHGSRVGWLSVAQRKKKGVETPAM